jgi:hypothetical protein
MEKVPSDLSVLAALKAVGIVITVILGLWGLDAYLDHRVETKINNPEFIKKVATQVRPSLIFDTSGSILVDIGAIQYISDIKVDTEKRFPYLPKKATVVPKSYLSHAPIMTFIDPVDTIIKAERGASISWIYSFDITGHVAREESEKTRLRLEVTP